MKEQLPLVITVMLMPFIIAGIIKFAYARQDEMNENQQKLNFTCMPRVYVESFSNHDGKFAVCLMKQNSKEFEVREVVK